MKKLKGLLLCLVCLICVISLTGCDKKVAISSETFIEKTNAKGYTLYDVTEQFADSYVAKAYVAIDKNEEYQIEFYVIDTEVNAKEFFEYNKELFESDKPSKNVTTSVNLNNHSKYTLETDETYKTISRIDNTVLYSNADISFKTIINDLVKELGY